MNPPSDFESQLRQLRPQPPSAELRQRIAAQLAAPLPRVASSPCRPLFPGLRAILERLCWAGLGATALWFAQGVMKPAHPTPELTAASSALATHGSANSLQNVKPTTQEEEISVADEGVRFSSNGAALRKIRRVYLEKTSWPDLANGGALEVQWPREELVYLPVPVQ